MPSRITFAYFWLTLIKPAAALARRGEGVFRNSVPEWKCVSLLMCLKKHFSQAFEETGISSDSRLIFVKPGYAESFRTGCCLPGELIRRLRRGISEAGSVDQSATVVADLEQCPVQMFRTLTVGYWNQIRVSHMEALTLVLYRG